MIDLGMRDWNDVNQLDFLVNKTSRIGAPAGPFVVFYPLFRKSSEKMKKGPFGEKQWKKSHNAKKSWKGGPFGILQIKLKGGPFSLARYRKFRGKNIFGSIHWANSTIWRLKIL